jgi:hypothetical protein
MSSRMHRFTTLVAVIAVVASFSIPVTPSARALSQASVVVVPPVTSVFGQYDISFVLTSALTAGSGSIELVFPQGSVLPCGCGGVGWTASDFTVNGIIPTSSPAGEADLNRVTVTTPVNLAAGQSVAIRIKSTAMIKNPYKAGTYRMTVKASSEAAAVESLPFTVSDSTVMDVRVVGVPTYAGSQSALSIEFRTGVHGALTGRESSISIEFPGGFSIPGSLPRGSVAINGVVPDTAGQWQGRMLTIDTPVDISAGSPIRVDIAEKARIGLPSVPGRYQVSVSTSSETTAVLSAYLDVTPPPDVRASIVVMPSELPDGSGGYYVRPVTCVVMASSNTGNAATIHYRTDGGGWQTSTGTPVAQTFGNGPHSIEYWADDGVSRDPSDPLKTYSRSFLIDTTAPQLLILKPESTTVSVYNSVFSIEGTVAGISDGVTLAVNRVPVSIAADGRFAYPIQLTEGVNTVDIEAKDPAGNVASQTLTFTLSTVVPKLIVTAPVSWQKVTGGSVTVTGTINVDAVVTVNGNLVAVSETGAFTYDLDIGTVGEPLVVVAVVATAKDSGYSTQKTVMVTRAPVEPPKPDTVLSLSIGTPMAIVNGKAVLLDAAPFIDKVTGRTLVPLRFISEELGGVVTWEPLTRAVTIAFGEHFVQLGVGNQTALKDGQSITIEQPPVIIPPGRTMVPLRFIAEAMGATVDWNGVTRTILVTLAAQQ